MQLYRFMFLAMLGLFQMMSRTDDPAPDPEPRPDRAMTRSEIRAEVARQVEAAKSQAEIIDKITTLQQENFQFRNSKHRLTPEQHAEWLAYQALGPAAEVSKLVAAVPTLESDLARYREAEKIDATAGKLGIKSATAKAAFKRLLGGREFEIVEIPGQEPQVLVIDGTNKTPIREYVKASADLSWAEPVIFADIDMAAQGAAPAGQPATPTAPAHGAAFIAQTTGTPPAAQGAIDGAALAEKYNAERNANRVSPLATK